MFPDELLGDFRRAWAIHGDSNCMVQATPSDLEPPESCIGFAKLPPIDGVEQHSYWLNVKSLFDSESASRDFIALAARAGASLPAAERQRLKQPSIVVEPAAIWCVALLRFGIVRYPFRYESVLELADGPNGIPIFESLAIPEWHRPFAASVELLEHLGATDSKCVNPDLPGQELIAPNDPSIEVKADGYSDPDNFERNIWLYEQRKAMRRWPVIMAELNNGMNGWSPLYAENACRNAVKSIANFHGWTIPKVTPGRPRKPSSDEPETPNTPQ